MAQSCVYFAISEEGFKIGQTINFSARSSSLWTGDRCLCKEAYELPEEDYTKADRLFIESYIRAYYLKHFSDKVELYRTDYFNCDNNIALEAQLMFKTIALQALESLNNIKLIDVKTIRNINSNNETICQILNKKRKKNIFKEYKKLLTNHK